MIIGITINNLLRDHIPQVKRAYQELTGLEPIEPINPFDMEKSFPTIQSTKVATEFVVNEEGNELPEMVLNEDNEEGFDVHELMYKDAAFEIFGRCEELTPGLIHMLKSIEKKCGVEFVLLNKESTRSKNATLFFLSKHNFDFGKLYFPNKEKDFWTNIDVLITDNPKILKAKPKDKVSVKVKNDFNLDIKSDFSIINLNDMKNLKNIIKLIKNKEKNQ